MAQTAEVEIATAANVARLETKRLAKQLRVTVHSLAELEATCRKFGIDLEVETDTKE